MSLVKRGKDLLRALGLTFWLQVAAMSVAARSAEVAGWVETPPLVLVVFMATLTAAFLVRRKRQRWTNHLGAVLLGASLAYIGGVYLAESDQWYHRFGDLHGRVTLWWEAVVGEDLTTDTLPLSIVLTAITWLVAYFTAWALFRYQNAWATVLPIGAGITINLTYLPEQLYSYFFAFLFIALLLIAHMTSLRRRSQMQAQGIPYPTLFHQLSLAHGLGLSAITLSIAMLLPLGDSPIVPLRGAFRPVDRSVDSLRDELHRIFAAVPGHSASSIRFFGNVFPLVRPIPTGEKPVFFAESRFPLYWQAIAYDQYTSKAWKVEESETIPLLSASDSKPVEEGNEFASAPSPTSVFYRVRLHVSSPYLMIAGAPILVEPDARQEIPAPRTFQVDLVNLERNRELPLSLQRWASALPLTSEEVGNLGVEHIPFDLLVTGVTRELSFPGRRYTISVEAGSSSYYSDLRQALQSEGRLIGMEVIRMPVGSSPIAYRPFHPLEPGSEYSVIAEMLMSLASEATLRSAPQSYPSGVLDRYLQLPETLPSRVVELARALSVGTSNPYDKAVAIETYLRDLDYSTVTQSIPHDADVVDHFLFELKEGYSDYFSTAMAVMLRGIGIPTRLVLGFSPGVKDPDGMGYTVRDKDSHSWPEAYFPNVGWVAFEPTPIYEPRPRGLSGGFLDLAALGGEGLPLEGIGTEPGPLDPEEEQEKRDDLGGPLPGGFGERAPLLRHFGSPLGLGGALFALFLLMGAALLRALWVRQYGELRYPDAAFERMHRLASFLGIPSPLSQTPFEFAHSLSLVVPAARQDIELVCAAFVRQRYGGKETSAIEGIRVTRAFHRAKRELLARLMGGREPSRSPAQDAII